MPRRRGLAIIHMKIILFLCTGNYYRSRFTEYFFNHQAQKLELDWRAVSRGIAVELGTANVGPLSQYAVLGLEECGLKVDADAREPCQLQLLDMERSDMIVAIDESEHRDLLAKRFPGWENRILYWHIHDLGGTRPAIALAEMKKSVKLLVENLATQKKSIKNQ
jgi:protein-tyrosine phosphatase